MNSLKRINQSSEGA